MSNTNVTGTMYVKYRTTHDDSWTYTPVSALIFLRREEKEEEENVEQVFHPSTRLDWAGLDRCYLLEEFRELCGRLGRRFPCFSHFMNGVGLVFQFIRCRVWPGRKIPVSFASGSVYIFGAFGSHSLGFH